MSIYKVAINILVNWVTNFRSPKFQKSSILTPCFQILGNTLLRIRLSYAEELSVTWASGSFRRVLRFHQLASG